MIKFVLAIVVACCLAENNPLAGMYAEVLMINNVLIRAMNEPTMHMLNRKC